MLRAVSSKSELKKPRNRKKGIKKMMKNKMKNIVLTGVLATVMVAGLSAPAVAEELRDHHDDGSSDVGMIADPVRASGKDANEGIVVVADPVNKDPGKDNQGIIVDPVRDTADNAEDAPKKTQGPISIHCAPGYEFVKGEDPSGREDTCGPEDGNDTLSETTQPEKKLSEEIATAKEGALAEKATTASGVPPSSEDGQANDWTEYGCPEGYEYDEKVDTCLPYTFGALDSIFGGPHKCCYSVGEGIAWWGNLPADILKVTGAGFGSILLDSYIGETLSDWGEEIGGPLGWPLQGLGAVFSFTGQVFSGAVGGLGQLVGYASDGVGDVIDDVADGAGDVIDDIGSAAEDAWDTVSGWF
jgi:hypothetical protein